jgi:hypothetical protein
LSALLLIEERLKFSGTEFDQIACAILIQEERTRDHSGANQISANINE